jgi:hypothetical protein
MTDFTEQQKIIIAKVLSIQGSSLLLDDGLPVNSFMLNKLYEGYLKDVLFDDLIKDSVETFDKCIKHEQQSK